MAAELLRECETDAEAEQLRDALDDHGISAELRARAVWIDQGQRDEARALVSRFFEQGEHEAFAASARRGLARREVQVRVRERAAVHQAAVADQLRALARTRRTPLTWVFIAISVFVTVLTQLSFRLELPVVTFDAAFPWIDIEQNLISMRPEAEFIALVSRLMMADPFHFIAAQTLQLAGRDVTWLALPVSEPWRMVTPIFVHFGVLHLVFNSLWMKDLGRTIEVAHGSLYLGAFVLVSGALSNIAQYEISGSPMFGGLSGVVYGLLGLVWTRGRLQPAIGYRLTSSTVQFMLLWLAMGFLGNFGVANYCHLGGLLVGIAWAYIAFLSGPSGRSTRS